MNILSKITSLVLFLLMGTASFAQARIGLKGGVNLNNIASNYEGFIEPETKFKVGYHIGLVAQFELSEMLDIQSGLIYNSKGFSLDSDLSDLLEGDDYLRTSLNYLEIPFNLNYNFTDCFSGYFGPYVAFGLGGKTVGEIIGQSTEEIDWLPKSGEVNLNDFDDDEAPFKAVDFGLNFGFGASPLEKTLVSFNYSLGLSNLSNDRTDGTTSVSADKFQDFNRVLSLSLTYFFN